MFTLVGLSNQVQLMERSKRTNEMKILSQFYNRVNRTLSFEKQHTCTLIYAIHRAMKKPHRFITIAYEMINYFKMFNLKSDKSIQKYI